jgi:heme/copper-type cytochrome/quinol oxidase subunit 2
VIVVRRHILLVVGAVLIGIALVVGAVGGASAGTGATSWNGFDHMFDRGHMGGFWTGSAPDPSAPAIEGAPEVTVVGTEFGFTPDVITVTQGEPVNVTFVNDGRILHDFTVPELGISVQAGPGQEATVGFNPKEAGVYSVVCTLPGHASQGMTATLVVEDDT